MENLIIKRQRYISDCLETDMFIPKVIANLTSIYDYYLKGEVYQLGEPIPVKTNDNDNIECIAELPDGRIVCGLRGGIIKIWNLKTGTCEHRQIIDGGSPIRSIIPFPDGQILIPVKDAILRYNLKDNIDQCDVWRFERFDNIEHIVTIQPKGNIVYACRNGALKICKNIEDSELLFETEKCPDLYLIQCMAYLPDGRIVTGHFSHGNNGRIAVWDINTGKVEIILSGHTDSVKCILVISNQIIISGSSDSTIKIWDLVEEKCIQTLREHWHSVACIAKLPDGRLISGSYDSTLRIWNLKKGNGDERIRYKEKSIVIFKDNAQNPITKILPHSNGQIFFVSKEILNVLN